MSTFNNTSLYYDTENDGMFRDYYVPRNIDYDTTDFYFLVTEKYMYKPGLLAYDLYGDARLSWIFSYFNRNQILDPIFDLIPGIIIRVPTKQRLLDDL